MQEENWFEHFDESPYERVSRLVPDSFGSPIAVSLHRVSWAYLDWIDETYNSSSDSFFTENHKLYDPREGDFDSLIEEAVYSTYLKREKRNLPRPPWCAPAMPFEYQDVD